jgi:surface carbohydrate biosynthesis protein
MPVYLHCELIPRDLDARLLIASYVLKAGIPVVIGQQWSIIHNAPTAPRGVNVFATSNRYQTEWMQICRTRGNKVIAMDEEGLALKDERTLLENVDAAVAQSCDVFAFQDAEKQTLLDRVIPGINGRITGSARIELLGHARTIYQNEVERCRKSGKYILVNTNLSLINSVRGSFGKTLAAVPEHLLDDPAVLYDILEIHGRQKANLENLTPLLKWLTSSCPGHRIVLRPHPTERAEMWQSFPGLEVVAGESAIPWMLGADLVLHTGSTTGLEAAFLNVPCLNIGQPDHHFIIDQLNCCIHSIPEITVAVVAYLENRSGPIATFKTSVGAFEFNGARNIANIAVDMIREMNTVNSTGEWVRQKRNQVLKDKFSITKDDFAAKALAICGSSLQQSNIHQIDDSLFLLSP